MVEDNETVIAFARRHIPFVTQSKFQGQIPSPLVTVLHEKAKRALRDAAGLIAQRHAERVRSALKERGDSREVEPTGALPKVVVEKLPEFTAELDRVFPRRQFRVSAATSVVSPRPEGLIAGPPKFRSARNADLRQPDGLTNAILDAKVGRVELGIRRGYRWKRLNPRRAR